MIAHKYEQELLHHCEGKHGASSTGEIHFHGCDCERERTHLAQELHKKEERANLFHYFGILKGYRLV